LKLGFGEVGIPGPRQTRRRYLPADPEILNAEDAAKAIGVTKLLLLRMARDVFYAKRGRINVREIQDQMNSCSCLTLILACIIYWQASEISRIVTYKHPEENGIDLSLLEHISPIEWDNVVLYGQYQLNKTLIRP